MTSSLRLQRDADAARVGLADTLGQLRDGIAPTALSGEAIALVKETGLSVIKSLAEQARANPVPALLVGAGLTMLLTKTTAGDVMNAAGSVTSAASATAAAAAGAASTAARAAGDGVLDATERATSVVGQTVDALHERVTGTVEAAGEGVRRRYVAARGKMQDAVGRGRMALHDSEEQVHNLALEAQDRATLLADQTRRNVMRLLEEQPIFMAALGAAMGAAIGAALPLSKQEKGMLGELGATALDAGRDALSSATGALRDEAAKADLGAKVGEIAGKVADSAVGGAAKT